MLWGPATTIPVMTVWGGLSRAEFKPQIIQANLPPSRPQALGRRRQRWSDPPAPPWGPLWGEGWQPGNARRGLRQKPSCHPGVLGGSWTPPSSGSGGS